MKKIQQILFPTDFSATSETAFAFALEIANRFQCKLSMLHVYEVPNIAPTSVFTTLEETIAHVSEEMKAVSANKLKRLQERAKAYGVSSQIFTRQGDVNDEIINMINNSTDLVIMGTKGKHADRGLFVGSTANAIIRLASCPVFCVPEEASLKQISRIAYATDLRYDETEIVSFNIALAKAFDAEVIILHIDRDAENKEWSIEMLKDLISSQDYTKVFYREVVAKDVLDGISAFVQESEVDVISTTTYNTSFFDRLLRKSHTKEILMYSKIPLLAFNRKKHDTIFL